jgi:hypothetical protein
LTFELSERDMLGTWMEKRKATAEATAERLRARAESNGYKRGVHRE